jgi:hypothetical protein
VSTGIIVGTIALALIAVVVGLVVDRRYPVLPRPEQLQEAPAKPAIAHAAGESPATAIRARESAVAKLRVQRCQTCRAAMANDADDTVRYDERELLVLHFTCAGCGARRSLYLDRA